VQPGANDLEDPAAATRSGQPEKKMDPVCESPCKRLAGNGMTGV